MGHFDTIITTTDCVILCFAMIIHNLLNLTKLHLMCLHGHHLSLRFILSGSAGPLHVLFSAH